VVCIVGRGYKDGLVELRDRFAGTSSEVPVADALELLSLPGS